MVVCTTTDSIASETIFTILITILLDLILSAIHGDFMIRMIRSDGTVDSVGVLQAIVHFTVLAVCPAGPGEVPSAGATTGMV